VPSGFISFPRPTRIPALHCPRYRLPSAPLRWQPQEYPQDRKAQKSRIKQSLSGRNYLVRKKGAPPPHARPPKSRYNNQ
jgi:hypothetical protein